MSEARVGLPVKQLPVKDSRAPARQVEAELVKPRGVEEGGRASKEVVIP